MNPKPAGRIFTAAEINQLGRCHHCEWHPPTQGHAPTCPEFPIIWLKNQRTYPTATAPTDTPSTATAAGEDALFDVEGTPT